MNVWALVALCASGLIAAFGAWVSLKQAQSTGGQLQAAKTNAATGAAQTAIAQAEASAPATREAVVDRLNKGTF